jgi:hypothetical protein
VDRVVNHGYHPALLQLMPSFTATMLSTITTRHSSKTYIAIYLWWIHVLRFAQSRV